MSQVHIWCTDSNVIRCEIEEAGIKKQKTITYEDLATAIESVKIAHNHQNEKVHAWTLPFDAATGVFTLAMHSFPTGLSEYILLKTKCRRTMILETEGRAQTFSNVGIPDLLFKIIYRQAHMISCQVWALADAISFHADTVLYRYPFSNVHGGYSICWGNNKVYKQPFHQPAHLVSVPNMFLEMPNNMHLYHKEYTTQNLDYVPLLQALEGQDFPTPWLVPSTLKYKDL